MTRTTPSEAWQEFRVAGLSPLEPYPGRVETPWRARCRRCNKEVNPRLNVVRRSATACKHCAKEVGAATLRAKAAATAVAEFRAAGLEPLEPYVRVRDNVKSKCLSCGEMVTPSLERIRAGGRGCRPCSLRRAWARKHPKRAAEAKRLMRNARLEPLVDYPGTLEPWRCQCKRCDAIVTPTHNAVKQGGSGCRACSYRLRGEKRRVPSAEAWKVMKSAGFVPLDPYPGAGEPWRSRCLTCQQVSTPRLHTARRGSRCRFCFQPRHDGEVAAKEIRSYGLVALEPFRSVNEPWRVRCLDCGNESTPRYGKILKKAGKVCKHCSGKAVLPEDAVRVMQKHGYEPLEPYPGSLGRWRCKCRTCGRERFPTHASVKSQGTRCAYCMHVIADGDEAADFMRSRGLEPLVAYPGASVGWKCRCTKCEKIVKPTIGTIRAGGGCRYCAERGIQYDKPCDIYLITHEGLGAHKIGIGAPSGYRIRRHRQEGWELYRKRTFKTGNRARKVEQAVLEWLRIDLELPPGVRQQDMPQAGWTETVPASTVELPDIWEMVERFAPGRART